MTKRAATSHPDQGPEDANAKPPHPYSTTMSPPSLPPTSVSNNASGSTPKRRRRRSSTTILAPDPNPLPSTSFYTISHSSTLNLQAHLDTLLAALNPSVQTLLASWATHATTLPDKDFQTLDCTVKILQTHQPDPTKVCPLLAELGDLTTPELRITTLSLLVQVALHLFSALGGRPRNSIPGTPVTEIQRTASSPRNASVMSRCLRRDGNRSVLSMHPSPEVAHIIPRAAGNIGGGAFWSLVDMFLGAGGAEELRVFAFGDAEDGCTDTVSNTMCLNSLEHGSFDRGEWEIVPTLDGLLPYSASTCVEYPARIGFLSKKPIGLVGYTTTEDGGTRINDEIMDGHLITLRTPNPAELPLPHPLLLQMHSVFARILHLKASAGYPENEGSESSAEWVGDAVEGREGSAEWVGDAVEADRLAERLTSKLLALGQVEKEERVGGWVESVPSEVIEVPESKLLGERVWATREVALQGAGKKEKVAGPQWQAPTPAASTYTEQRKRKRRASFGPVEGGPEEGEEEEEKEEDEANTFSKKQREQGKGMGDKVHAVLEGLIPL